MCLGYVDYVTRKTTDAEDRRIRTAHLRNRVKTASEPARNGTGNQQISRLTVSWKKA